jgi:hypothetical protein
MKVKCAGMACFTYNSVFALSGPRTVANTAVDRRALQVRKNIWIRELQRDVVYLGWPLAPSYMSPNAEEGWELRPAGSQPMSTAVHRSPNNLWRSNSIINLRFQHFMSKYPRCRINRTIRLKISVQKLDVQYRKGLRLPHWQSPSVSAGYFV